MNKTLIIIGREFNNQSTEKKFSGTDTRRSILLAGFLCFPDVDASEDDTQDRKIAVINQSVTRDTISSKSTTIHSNI